MEHSTVPGTYILLCVSLAAMTGVSDVPAALLQGLMGRWAELWHKATCWSLRSSSCAQALRQVGNEADTLLTGCPGRLCLEETPRVFLRVHSPAKLGRFMDVCGCHVGTLSLRLSRLLSVVSYPASVSLGMQLRGFWPLVDLGHFLAQCLISCVTSGGSYNIASLNCLVFSNRDDGAT